MAEKFAPRTRQQGLRAAREQVTNVPRMCAATVRGFFGLGPLGDYDGDGAADAEDMWKAAKVKHPGDRNPPNGVPVYYGGGSTDNGHIGVADNGRLRGTDGAGSGRMGTTPLSFPETAWGMPYLGWSEDLYGYMIVDQDRVRLEKWQAKLRAKRKRISTKLVMIRKRLAEKK